MAEEQGITRRALLAAAGASVGPWACSSAPGPGRPAPRPNIVLCMGDDHGWHETGYNGHSQLQTPVLDEMAAGGLRLDRFYSAAPVCSPTRGSVITGRHPNRYGTFGANWSIRPEEVGIAEILRDAGYACGHFGKWHLGPVKAASPTNPGAFGFEEWLSHDNFFEMDPVLSRNGALPERHRGESSQILVDEAVRFIDRAQGQGRPFFVVIWFGSPHEPYSGVEEDLGLYRDLPPSVQGRTARITSMETGGPGEFPLADVLEARFAEITAMDRALGRLRRHLREREVRDDTLLWYCSDNGAPAEGAFDSPLRAQKGRVYEGGVRVPGIVEWPARISEPRSTAVPAVTSDILPTLCDVAGQPLPDRPLDGVSLLPLFDGEMEQRPAPICFWSYSSDRGGDGEARPYIDLELQEGTTPLVKRMGGLWTRNFRNFRYPQVREEDLGGPRAILDARHKLVMDGEVPRGSGSAMEPKRELFDMRADPGEAMNLAADHPQTVVRLERMLRAWQESVLSSLTGADYG